MKSNKFGSADSNANGDSGAHRPSHPYGQGVVGEACRMLTRLSAEEAASVINLALGKGTEQQETGFYGELRYSQAVLMMAAWHFIGWANSFYRTNPSPAIEDLREMGRNLDSIVEAKIMMAESAAADPAPNGSANFSPRLKLPRSHP